MGEQVAARIKKKEMRAWTVTGWRKKFRHGVAAQQPEDTEVSVTGKPAVP